MADHADATADGRPSGPGGSEVSSRPHVHEVAVVGGGVSGIGMGALLHRDGVEDFVLLEKAGALGGTWHQNTYPDCACDIPSHLYQFGFRPNPDWSRVFAPQPEIERYLSDVAEEHDLLRRTRFHTEMLDARWDSGAGRWEITTTRGRVLARFLVLGTGSLHAANDTAIPGADRFRGRTFHTSRWPAGYDGTGERVAVIGTGASSIQVTPALQRRAARVTVFQRTPAWIQPRPNWRHSRFTRTLLRRSRSLRLVYRAAMWAAGEVMLRGSVDARLGAVLGLLPRLHLRLAVRDRRLRRALRPDYTMGCKRLLVSSDFYPALQSPNAELIDSEVVEITEDSVVAADGRCRHVDTIVHATGFHFGAGFTARRIRGLNGVPLSEAWGGCPRGHLGTTVAGFPNLALLWGPNTGTASLFVTIEAQARYLLGMLRCMRERGIEALDVTAEAQDRFRARAERKLAASVVNVGGCRTWYADESGHNQLIWPGTMLGMWRELSRFDLESYRDVSPTPVGGTAATASAPVASRPAAGTPGP